MDRKTMLAPLPPDPALSARLNEVLALLSVGASDFQIALALTLSPRSVGKYVQRIADKLHIEREARCPHLRLLVVRVAVDRYHERLRRAA